MISFHVARPSSVIATVKRGWMVGSALLVMALVPRAAWADEPGIDGFDLVWGGSVPHAVSVAAAGNYVYVNGAGRRTEAYDISDPENPFRVANFPPGGWRLALEGDDLYSYAHTQGVHYFDVSTGIPWFIDSFSVGDPFVSFAGGLRVADSLFVAAHQQGIYVLDVGPPMSEQSVIDLGDNAAYDVVRSGDHLLVANGRHGLAVVSIHAPRQVEASLALPGLANDIVLAEGDSIAFVSLGPDGLASIDVRDVRDPRVIAIQETRGNAWEMSILGSELFVGAFTQAEKYDVSDPARMRRVAWEETENVAFGVAPTVLDSGDTLVAVADWAGLRLYELSMGAVPDIAVFPERIDFGEVGEATIDTVIRVFNTGGGLLEGGVYSVPLDFQVTPRRFTVDPGGVRELTVSTSGSGNIAAAIRFVSNDPDEEELDQLVYKNNTTFPQVGSPAPDFTLVGTEGESHTLSDYRGRPVYLQFGANW